MDHKQDETVLGEGRHLVLRRRKRWEFVERTQGTDVVVLVAVTPDQQAVLIEQYREPVQARMIEWPAGLVGDEEAYDNEHMLDAANRELEEETGFRAKKLTIMTKGPPSAGLSSEIVTFIRATDLERVGTGGGVAGEDITVHLVPLAEIDSWLDEAAKRGCLIDPKVYSGLYLLSQHPTED